MERDEKIIVAILAVAFVALLIARYAAPADQITAAPAEPDTPSLTRGPSYTMYNAPWAFGPPVANMIPMRSQGQLGQVAGQGRPTPARNIICCEDGQ